MLTLIPFVSSATISVAGWNCFKLVAVFGTLLVVVNSIMGVVRETGLRYIVIQTKKNLISVNICGFFLFVI